MKGLFIFPVLLILLFGSPASADLEKGRNAYNSGDFETALSEYKSLAKQGDANGQLLLGAMYFAGKGVIQDYEAAIKWIMLAAKQGYVESQDKLGLMYAQGLGVTQDYNAAFKWFKLAAEQGYADAQYNLGIMYEEGYGVIQDYTRAYMWWDIAASKGNELAAGGRANVQKVLTPAQLKKAKKLTRECVAKNYKDC